jgi:hypothetical protein
MRQISFTCIVSFLFLFACDTANNVDPVFQNYFIKYYGEDGNQEGVDLLVNTDGTMVLLGNSTMQSNIPVPFILKTDPAGNVLWKRQLGELNERAADVALDNQGNLIVVSNIGEGDASRIRLLRMNQSGNGIDSIKIDNGEKQIARSVVQVSNNNFLIAGNAAADPLRNPPTMPIPPEDESDIIVVEVDPAMTQFIVRLGQGGEHVGSAVKIFESNLDGKTTYFVFGDSDRPVVNTDVYKRSFEVIPINIDGVQGESKSTGIPSEIQTLSTVVETPASLQEGYLMVGTTFKTNSSSNIYITQYDKSIGIPRLDDHISELGQRLEGVSAACSESGSFYILANEVRENNNRDIFLVKLSSDGVVVGFTSFGTLEGDDAAGAVHVLGDGRVAVFGTMALETQNKMALIILSQDGKFSD